MDGGGFKAERLAGAGPLGASLRGLGQGFGIDLNRGINPHRQHFFTFHCRTFAQLESLQQT